MVALLAGAPGIAAGAIGALLWFGRAAVSIRRRRRPQPIRLDDVRDPWRSLVRQAMETQRRFAEAVGTAKPGPLRDHLGEVGRRIDAGLRAGYQAAQRGDLLDRTMAGLGVSRIREQLTRVDAQLRGEAARAAMAPTADAPGGPGAGSPTRQELEAAANTLRHQLASAEHLQRLARETEDRLRQLDAELTEAVARAVELARATTQPEQAGLDAGAGIDAVVAELETLRQALEETAAGPDASPGPEASPGTDWPAGA